MSQHSSGQVLKVAQRLSPMLQVAGQGSLSVPQGQLQVVKAKIFICFGTLGS